MLDLTLRDVRGVSITFAKSTHTAIVGPPASGVSTLLRLIAGEIRPESGSILIGARDVTRLTRSRRPLLYATHDIDAPQRWSVRHLLVASVRQRSLDRIDRQREFDLAVSKWKLESLADRTLRTLSSSESTRANLARIELLKPAILVADRVVNHASLADDFYRILRVMGTTVISAPASTYELGFTDRVIVIDAGRVIQDGTFSQVYREPVSVAAAQATGDVNLVPVTVRGKSVESVIGNWDVAEPPFQGEGTAAIRPEEFEVAAKGEESDVIFGIEEATFHGDRWRATGILTGNVSLTVSLPRETAVHKGRLLALRYNPKRIKLLPR